MSEYKEVGKGRLYTNNFKVSDKHPDYKGHITINNKEYSIAGWDNGPLIGLTISNGVGKLFKNNNSSGSYPDFSGKINKGASEYGIAGWSDGSSIGLKLTSKL
tara:strand:- start:261 stop:569 length:309 start_codon:yes stop_codon:yes gene_type:complete